jgi:hypothetical protein
VHGRQQGVKQREPGWWLAVLTLITRIEDELATQAITTAPSGRRNAKLDIEVCPADRPMAPASSTVMRQATTGWSEWLGGSCKRPKSMSLGKLHGPRAGWCEIPT